MGTTIINGNLEVTGQITHDSQPIDETINITWSELKALRDNSQLTPGRFYRITDYETTSSHGGTSVAGFRFDVIVTALSENELSEEASVAHSDQNPIWWITLADSDVEYEHDILHDGIVDGVQYYCFYKSGATHPYICTTSLYGIDETTPLYVMKNDLDYDQPPSSTGVHAEVLDNHVTCTQVYFAKSNLSAWKIRYCLDNDNGRFSWADGDGIIINRPNPQVYRRAPRRDLFTWSNPYCWINCSDYNSQTIYTNVENPGIGDIAHSSASGGTEDIEYTIEGLYQGNGKGVIFRMIDEFDNDVPYDFKNIIFEKKQRFVYASPSTNSNITTWNGYIYTREPSLDADGYYGWVRNNNAASNRYTTTTNITKDTILYKDTSGTTDTGDYVIRYICKAGNYFTFDTSSASNPAGDDSIVGDKFNHNIIMPYNAASHIQTLNFIHSKTLKNSIIGINNYESELQGTEIIIGANSYYNDITSAFSIKMGDSCVGNTIKNFRYNTIGNRFSCNNIDGNAQSGYSSIGDDFANNNIGTTFRNNIIGNQCSGNTIGKSFYSNHIGNEFVNNTVGDNFYRNNIGNRFSSNVVGKNFYGNTVGNSFTNNTLGTYVYNCIFDNTVNHITIGATSTTSMYVGYCTFDTSIQYIDLTSNDAASSSSIIKYVHIHSGTQGTSSEHKTITVNRGLTYTTDVYPIGSTEMFI